MGNTSLYLPEEIRNRLKEEKNQSALVAKLLNDYFLQESDDGPSDKEITTLEEKLARKKKEIYKYKLKACSEWIQKYYKIPDDKVKVLAVEWIKEMTNLKQCVTIYYFMLHKGYESKKILKELANEKKERN